MKSLTLDASVGISQASVVDGDDSLTSGSASSTTAWTTDALGETYIEGRELYVGLDWNQSVTALPVWELNFARLPEESRRIADR